MYCKHHDIKIRAIYVYLMEFFYANWIVSLQLTKEHMMLFLRLKKLQVNELVIWQRSKISCVLKYFH